MVDFLVALPAPFRFGDGSTTKRLLRKIVERRVGPEVANRSKYGASAPLWKVPAVYATLGIDEALRATRLFRLTEMRADGRCEDQAKGCRLADTPPSTGSTTPVTNHLCNFKGDGILTPSSSPSCRRI